MKICSAICEYNPLHLGHIKHLNYIKENLKPDYTVIFMSGNFTQRGEGAILDKYTRATHAIKAGADVVIELPTVFAVSNAEIFAKGGVKLINSLPKPNEICFGTETNDLNGLISTAKELAIESVDFKKVLKRELDKGEPLVKARITALEETSSGKVDLSFVNSPNNILALEYVKAILENNYDLSIKPIKREGDDYNQTKIQKNNPSALAIRTAIKNGKLSKTKNFVPYYVYKDLPKKLPSFDKEIIFSLLKQSKTDISKITDCSEGLENKIKALIKDNYTIEDLLFKLKSKRYTEARLKRILYSSMLNVTKDFTLDCLNSDLYLKVLAVNKSKETILSDLSSSKYPLITRKSDVNKLSGTALDCFMKDVEANDIYNLITNNSTNEYEMKII